MPTLAIESLTKTYRHGVRAVDRLSLQVEDGAMLVLAGPSGCGKTTTLRMIAGLEYPTAGVIRLGEREVTGLPPRDRDVAMVFQNYALYPHMTARQNLAFGPRMRRTPRAEIARRVDAAVALLGLGDLLDRKPGALSGGEQQRVALGRVLVRRPACALYDEPLSNLDGALRHRLRCDLRRLQEAAGTTSVYVTHDQEEAMTLGGRLAVMAAGRVLQVGSPLEIYERPATRFVAGFLGRPAMNFVEGRVVREDGATLFENGEHVRLPAPAAARETPLEEVVLGVRPEHLRLGAGDGPSIEIEIADVEPLGAYTDVTGRAGAVEIVVRAAGTTMVRPGERVPVGVDLARTHLFAPGEHGVRI